VANGNNEAGRVGAHGLVLARSDLVGLEAIARPTFADELEHRLSLRRVVSNRLIGPPEDRLVLGSTFFSSPSRHLHEITPRLHLTKRGSDLWRERLAFREALRPNSGLRPLQAVIAGEHLHWYSPDFERYSGEVAG
jgi:GrpB-like predicted nucleotidyltransferase (UPF0157 family)